MKHPGEYATYADYIDAGGTWLSREGWAYRRIATLESALRLTLTRYAGDAGEGDAEIARVRGLLP